MRDHWFIASQVGSLLFAIFLALSTWWLPTRAEQFQQSLPSLFFSSIVNFHTPVPWVLLFAGLYIFGVFKSQAFHANIAGLGDLQERLEAAEADAYNENSRHVETKVGYLKNLHSTLQYVLTQPQTGFDDRCRVTIYRIDENGQQSFYRIFRHARQRRFDLAGRDIIPIDEGMVGLAWATCGLRDFSCEHDVESKEFSDALAVVLAEAQVRAPAGVLSMPSRHILAKTISDHDGTTTVGVVVYECLDAGVLRVGEIEALLLNEDLNIARLVKLLGALEAEFHPI